jgi:hypothetical protein
VIAAQRHHEQILFRIIAAVMPAERESWVPRLLAPIEEGRISRREWLAAVPSSRAAGGLAEQIEKVGSSRNWAPTGWSYRICRSPAWSISRNG